MGKNGGNSWLDAVKKAFRSPGKDDHEKKKKKCSRRREENEQEEEDKKRGKRKWSFLKTSPHETTIQHNAAQTANSPINSSRQNLMKKITFDHNRVVISEQKRALTVAMATTAAAEAAVATAQAAVEIIRLTRPSLLLKEQTAALVIQTTFRGYLARRALFALKGIVKLQALIRGHNVRKRAEMTLQCIQSLVRVQTRVCDQRRRLSCERTSLGSVFNQAKSRVSSSINASNPSNDLDEYQSTLDEIQREIAHTLSQHKMWGSDEDQFSEGSTVSGKKIARNDRNLCNYRDSIKIVEIDTSRPYLFTAPKSHKSSSPNRKHQNNSQSSSPKINSIQVRSCSPRYRREEINYQTSVTPTLRSNYFNRMSMSENTANRPNFMSSTASTMARVRSHSVPKLRSMSPNREQTSSVKKRLSFPDDNFKTPRYKNTYSNQYGFEQCYTE